MVNATRVSAERRVTPAKPLGTERAEGLKSWGRPDAPAADRRPGRARDADQLRCGPVQRAAGCSTPGLAAVPDDPAPSHAPRAIPGDPLPPMLSTVLAGIARYEGAGLRAVKDEAQCWQLAEHVQAAEAVQLRDPRILSESCSPGPPRRATGVSRAWRWAPPDSDGRAGVPLASSRRCALGAERDTGDWELGRRTAPAPWAWSRC